MASAAETTSIHDEVRERYAGAALSVLQGQDASSGPDACCGDGCGCGAASESDDRFGTALYAPMDLSSMPDAAGLASLGCGNPVAVAELREGERVLDLGSGGGLDVLLSARRVGPTGFAYGLDMTDEMLELARRNAVDAGATNVEFIKGHIEAIPLPSSSVDVVISNCVVNLAADKRAVLGEIARVLRPGGRIGISDIVAEDHLDVEERRKRGSFAGCIAGALSVGEYRTGLAAVGMSDIEIELTHPVADAMHGAIVRAVKPD